MRFVGTLGLDGGGNDLNSRMTHPMSFAEAADWYKASCEYFAMAIKHDATLVEVTVSIYDAKEVSSITVEPICITYLRK
jgi:hypothetical protein